MTYVTFYPVFASITLFFSWKLMISSMYKGSLNLYFACYNISSQKSTFWEIQYFSSLHMKWLGSEWASWQTKVHSVTDRQTVLFQNFGIFALVFRWMTVVKLNPNKIGLHQCNWHETYWQFKNFTKNLFNIKKLLSLLSNLTHTHQIFFIYYSILF